VSGASALIDGLGRAFNGQLPTWEYQHGRVATWRSCEHLGALNTKTNPVIFNCRERSLRDATQLGQLILAQALKLTQYANRFADRNLDTLLGRAKLFHFTVSDSHAL